VQNRASLQCLGIGSEISAVQGGCAVSADRSLSQAEDLLAPGSLSSVMSLAQACNDRGVKGDCFFAIIPFGPRSLPQLVGGTFKSGKEVPNSTSRQAHLRQLALKGSTGAQIYFAERSGLARCPTLKCRLPLQASGFRTYRFCGAGVGGSTMRLGPASAGLLSCGRFAASVSPSHSRRPRVRTPRRSGHALQSVPPRRAAIPHGRLIVLNPGGRIPAARDGCCHVTGRIGSSHRVIAAAPRLASPAPA
jgi:hypothetical protein